MAAPEYGTVQLEKDQTSGVSPSVSFVSPATEAIPVRFRDIASCPFRGAWYVLLAAHSVTTLGRRAGGVEGEDGLLAVLTPDKALHMGIASIGAPVAAEQ